MLLAMPLLILFIKVEGDSLQKELETQGPLNVGEWQFPSSITIVYAG